ncbi:LysR family transcriptional regulator [Hoylesella buccalis]|uniref:LysR substrate-binding domain-containing protein n=1 Tax=Hoylesella buccalis TaxID=28127 RepID=UPI001D1582FE|nr:LysR substrate-binding domain-containing protein [Hoylesella buccalis]UEA62910.1 LysR family transcriptional regulator [Hoylesella buccalis]UWP49802.1 LysR substrate-binding domain-containing protein [Hoylesella buccalis ATCC 35310]
MELRQIRYFLKVAELLNFSEASKALFITQSTLSQQIRQLENEFDTILFERNSHEVSLTEAGKQFMRYARKVMIDVDDCTQKMDDLKNMLTGELNIGVTFTFSPLLTETVLEFMKLYPHVRLNVFYKTMSELMDMLQRREVDFVLAFKPTDRNDKIESHVLFNNHLSVVVSEQHSLAKRKSLTLDDLAPYDAAMPARGLQARNSFDDMIHSENSKLKIRVELNDVSILLKLIKQSKLITILADATIHDEDGLVAIPLEMTGNDMEGCIHLLKQAYVKNSAREFYRLLSQSRAILKYSSLAKLL